MYISFAKPVHSYTLLFVMFLLVLGSTSASLAWSPGNNWRDSYAVDGQCFCDSSNYDHDLDTKSARTPVGLKNVVEICNDIKSALGEGSSSGRIPYNDIQCGNGPVNNAADETGCPGRVDQGGSGCLSIGPRWNLEAVYGEWPGSCNASRPLLQNTWYMFSLPCDVQLPAKGTVAEVLADDLGIDTFRDKWIIYALLDDGSYKALELTDELYSGVGYWLVTIESDKTIEVTGEYPIETGVPLRAGSSSSGAWTLIGSPFLHSASWSDTQLIDMNTGKVSSLFSNGNTCTRETTSDNCMVLSTGYKWTESGTYDVLGQSSGQLNEFEGAWVWARSPGIRLRLPMPDQENQVRY